MPGRSAGRPRIDDNDDAAGDGVEDASEVGEEQSQARLAMLVKQNVKMMALVENTMLGPRGRARRRPAGSRAHV